MSVAALLGAVGVIAGSTAPSAFDPISWPGRSPTSAPGSRQRRKRRKTERDRKKTQRKKRKR